MREPWGTVARSFFKFVVKCAGSEGTRAAELYHWSASGFAPAHVAPEHRLGTLDPDRMGK